MTSYTRMFAIRLKLRTNRIRLFRQLIDATHKSTGEVRIIDIGGTERYWTLLPEDYLLEKKVTIKIVNLFGDSPPENHGIFSFANADACNLELFADNSFDLAHSNSVVEHVGDWQRMKMYAVELRRVSKAYFVQTPNYWFPIEPHCMTPFFHWLPFPIRVWLVQQFNLGNWKKAKSVDQAISTVESARLLNKAAFQELFKDSHIVTEKYFLLSKSFIAIKRTTCLRSAESEALFGDSASISEELPYS